jgi:peptide/nickel transport system permease protein
MRHALRRVLWIIPISFVISVCAFWLLTAGAGFRVSLGPGATDEPAYDRAALPRFFNSNPESLRDRAARAVRSIAENTDDAPAAQRELAQLGGAALPHVLPAFDSLAPDGRARVALALSPVAARMKLGSREELSDPNAAVVFWTRFWTDRSIDFRPAVVKRAVARLADKSTAGRREDVRLLDTYALPELIAAMTPLDTPSDVERARRVANVAAEIAEKSWTIEKQASVERARSVVSQWQAWWLEHQSDYVAFDGAARTLAMVSETQYGRWAAQAAQNGLGRTASGQTVVEVVRTRAPITLGLLAVGLVCGWLTGIIVGLAGATRPHRPLDLVLAMGAVGFAAVPASVLSTVLSPTGRGAQNAVAGALIALVAAAIVSRHQRSAARVALDQEYMRTARAFGAGPWRLARWSLRSSSIAVISLVGVHLPVLLTLDFVLEHAMGLEGLASPTLLAVTRHDVSWLMAVALGSTALLSLAQIVSDALMARLDPRAGVALAQKRGAFF